MAHLHGARQLRRQIVQKFTIKQSLIGGPVAESRFTGRMSAQVKTRPLHTPCQPTLAAEQDRSWLASRAVFARFDLLPRRQFEQRHHSSLSSRSSRAQTPPTSGRAYSSSSSVSSLSTCSQRWLHSACIHCVDLSALALHFFDGCFFRRGVQR